MYPNEFRAASTWTRPRDGRTITARLLDGCCAFRRAFRRRDVVEVRVIGGGDGSARITGVF